MLRKLRFINCWYAHYKEKKHQQQSHNNKRRKELKNAHRMNIATKLAVDDRQREIKSEFRLA